MAAKIRKGDKVIVLTGRDKGRTGEVIEVRPDQDRALVRGVNLVRRHPTQSAQREGGLGSKFVGSGDDRRKVRVARRSGVEIDG